MMCLVAFLLYFMVKLLIDVDDLGEIKAFTVGTSGGLIFSVALGTIISITLSDLYFRLSKNNQALKTGALLGFLYLVASLLIGVSIFVLHLSNIRMDYFLIQDAAGYYQRPGNFISINFMLLSTVLAIILLSLRTLKKIYKRLLLAGCVIIYILNALMSLVLSQLIGSNSGFAVVSILFVFTLVYVFLYLNTETERSGIGLHYGIRTIFLGKMGRKFFLIMLSTILLFSSSLWFLLTCYEIDPSLFRITGFGEDSLFTNSSFTSRVEFFRNNFITHFAYNPIFGNMKVDDRTTGSGTYVHSLFSLLSHLGIFGFILFLSFLFQSYRELVRFKPTTEELYYDNSFGFYRMLCIGATLFMASISAFFTWMPLWFALGIFTPSCIIKVRH